MSEWKWELKGECVYKDEELFVSIDDTDNSVFAVGVLVEELNKLQAELADAHQRAEQAEAENKRLRISKAASEVVDEDEIKALQAENAVLQEHNNHLMNELDRQYIQHMGFDFSEYKMCSTCGGNGYTEYFSSEHGYNQSTCAHCNGDTVVKRETTPATATMQPLDSSARYVVRSRVTNAFGIEYFVVDATSPHESKMASRFFGSYHGDWNCEALAQARADELNASDD